MIILTRPSQLAAVTTTTLIFQLMSNVKKSNYLNTTKKLLKHNCLFSLLQSRQTALKFMVVFLDKMSEEGHLSGEVNPWVMSSFITYATLLLLKLLSNILLITRVRISTKVSCHEQMYLYIYIN